MHKFQKASIAAVVLLLVLMLTAILLPNALQNNASPTQLFSKLIQHFQAYGYICELSPLTASEPNAKVAIFNASVWYKLTVGQELLYVYFDESNRADYLSSLIDAQEYGYVTHFGLRFVLTYQGCDQGLLAALDAL